MKLDTFEGPLDLLLHLINRYEIDIFDIPVARITEQYLQYIHTMQELKLDVASEYLEMAATLLQIKSKLLLPAHEEELEDEFGYDEFEEDPREELMRRLIEYKKYKEAAKQLQEFEEERSEIFTRSPGDLSSYAEETKQPFVSDVSIYDMLGALQKLFKRKKLNEPRTTTVQRQEVPIRERMIEIMDELAKGGGRRSFYSLFPSFERGHMVATFLAILELMKANQVHCEQEQNFDEIFIYQNKNDL